MTHPFKPCGTWLRVKAMVSTRQGAEYGGIQYGIVEAPILAAPDVTENLAVVQLDRDSPGILRLVPVSRVRPDQLQ